MTAELPPRDPRRPSLGKNLPSFPSSKNHKRWNAWTVAELRLMQSHPDMTAEELHELIPRHGVHAIHHARSRYGRYPTGAREVPRCQYCNERPVWVEERQARERGMCKGCWLEEMERRDREELANLRHRQSKTTMRRVIRKANDEMGLGFDLGRGRGKDDGHEHAGAQGGAVQGDSEA